MGLSTNKFNKDQTTQVFKSKREEKNSVHIKWNSRLFVQLGLIISLLTVYLIMQTKFEITENRLAVINTDYLDELPMVIYTLDNPIETLKKKTVRKQIQKKVFEVAEVNPDKVSDFSDTEIKGSIIEKIPTKIKTINSTNQSKKFNLIGVEFVPIYPGCESLLTNKEKRECMSSKIKTFIIRKFNTDKFDDGSIKGNQKITVQFNIDKLGNVSEVRALANDKLLQEEAVRVVSKLPNMKPGRQGDKIVEVQFMIPIVFKIDY